MRAPEFWAAPAGPSALCLAPFAALYGAVATARMRRTAPRAEIVTIAIGGLTMGGDGKTPVALALAAGLASLGERPAILTRGYGRSSNEPGPVAVDPERHSARDVGDEALLLARAAQTIVGGDRVAGARLAKTLGASALLLDDGLHSRRLDPNLAVLVVDADYGAGNGFCPPAGPLRAPLAAQFTRADVVVVVGEGEAVPPLQAQRLWRARILPDAAAAARLKGEKIFAFAGIGRPQKFLRTLREIGSEVVGCRWFPDHYPYRPADLAALRREAERFSARLVTTQKDAARLGHGDFAEVLPVTLAFDHPQAVTALLSDSLALARAKKEA
jgi:tetraacyldisaccharide 4'-kinase